MSVNAEYLTSNTDIAYPFTDDAPGLSRSGSAGFPQGLIVDTVLTVPAAFAEADTRLYLMRHHIDYGQVTFYIGDGNTELVVFTAVPGTGAWTTCGASGTDPELYVTGMLVFDTAVLTAFIADAVTDSVYTGLPFTPGVQCIDNPCVLSLGAYNAGPNGAGVRVDGDVQLLSGHNIAIKHLSTEAGLSTVRIDAVPGLGLGRWLCDEEEAEPGSPAGVSALRGDVMIEGDRCYAIVPHPTTGVIQIQGRCQACCTCDDYADMAGILKELADRLNAVKQVLDNGRETYEDGVAHYNDDLVPAGRGDIELTVNGMRGPDWLFQGQGDRGSPNRIRVVIQIKNHCEHDATIHSWYLSFTHPPGVVQFEDITYEYEGVSAKTTNGGNIPVVMTPGTGVAITLLGWIPLARWEQYRRWEARAGCVVVEDYLVEPNPRPVYEREALLVCT